MSNWDYANEAQLEAGRQAYALDDPKHPDYVDVHFEITDPERLEEPPMELDTISQPPALTLFGTADPDEVISEASRHAKALAEVIRQQRLYVNIGGKAHVYVEGWAMLGSMLGVYAIPGEVEPVEVEGVRGFRASAEARTRTGELVGAATAYCMRDEPNWKERPTYAVAAMAQTRASSMALRKPLGFVMKLAGYAPTPAEEMPPANDVDETIRREQRDPVEQPEP